ncbi:cell division protein FtsQ/DivIB [uncultured Arthrobacter sp.]|uniref:cell division protein FtsQ/DivIB n=1 Tax=uncultured Arthrobacter sp. TaxID=114050 RepID=UPI0026023EEA|nr:FtsQ-type POTRA domain-containing protein [uncultured Arthrobacter sp.]
MTTRPPRRPGKPAKQGGTAHGSETITAEKQVYPRQPRTPGPERVSASREAPVALLDREDESATVIAFPEPRGRRRRRWWLAAAISAVLLVAGVIAYLVFSPALAVRTLDIQGNRLVPEDQITAALEPLMGRSLTRIGDDDVRALLDAFPPIEDVSVAAAPPSTLSVTVMERTPVAILESGESFTLIDSEGRQLTTVADRESVALPLIDGGTNAVNSSVFSSIADVLAALPEDIRKRLVHASADSIDSVELKLTDGKTIFWGSAEENAAKAQVIAALLAQPEQEPPVNVYDVSTPSRPVTR